MRISLTNKNWKTENRKKDFQSSNSFVLRHISKTLAKRIIKASAIDEQ